MYQIHITFYFCFVKKVIFCTFCFAEHSTEVYSLLETKVDKVEQSFWNNLKRKSESKDTLVKAAEKSAYAAR